MGGFAENYHGSGGRATLSDYFVARGACATVVPFLKQRILFCDHSLATDAAFAEMHLISCRNVLIYFDKRAAGSRDRPVSRVARARADSSGSGRMNRSPFSRHASSLEILSNDEQIYRVK